MSLFCYDRNEIEKVKKSLERDNSIAMESMKNKMREMAKAHSTAMSALTRQYKEEIQEMRESSAEKCLSDTEVQVCTKERQKTWWKNVSVTHRYRYVQKTTENSTEKCHSNTKVQVCTKQRPKTRQISVLVTWRYRYVQNTGRRKTLRKYFSVTQRYNYEKKKDRKLSGIESR